MTKKYFKALADALFHEMPKSSPESAEMQQWKDDCKAVASVCSDSNPRFDWNRFMEACGISD